MSAQEIKAQATEDFKAGKLQEAVSGWTKAAEASDASSEIRIACLNNSAMGQHKQGLFTEAEETASKVIAESPENVKAYLRRAESRKEQGNLDGAQADLERAAEIDPEGKDIKIALAKVKKTIKESNKGSMFKGLFGKGEIYEEKSSWTPPPPRPYCWFDIEVDGEVIGRVTMQLYNDAAPKTVGNFMALCTGEKGQGKSGHALHFKGCKFHRIIKEFMIQGGDFTRGDGTGGESIYGEKFEDEAGGLKLKHDKPFLLSMANAGPNTNGSQFFITVKETPWLDGKHCVFGEVVEGQQYVKDLEALAGGNENQDRPTKPALIADCGVMTAEEYDSKN